MSELCQMAAQSVTFTACLSSQYHTKDHALNAADDPAAAVVAVSSSSPLILQLIVIDNPTHRASVVRPISVVKVNSCPLLPFPLVHN